MKLSMKADYAFRVLFTLVEKRARDKASSEGNSGGPISIRELAERNDIDNPFDVAAGTVLAIPGPPPPGAGS
jgi:DNA-binding IscR family transcriptional regulator